jgi:type II secretory pathway pseudopilin PulG
VLRSAHASAAARTSPRAGLTLLEILVVAAIVGLLVVLLLPGVQSSREAARRVRCMNNLKQVGLALWCYQDANGRFPSGGAKSPKDGWGHSWMLSLLPFVGQQPLYGQLDFDAVHSLPTVGYGLHTGYLIGWHPTIPGLGGNPYNADLVKGRYQDLYFCPSSNLGQWAHTNIVPPGPAGILRPTYAGITGAVDHPSTLDLDANTYIHDLTGQRSSGGLLVQYRWLRPADGPDGLSNTLIVGEQSGWCYDASGAEQDCRSELRHGFAMGPRNPAMFPYDRRTWNLTSVRYPVNTRTWEF